MKVLQIIPSVSLVYGGPSQMIRGLSESLGKQGADVTIVTTNSNGDVGQPPLDVPLDTTIPENNYKIRYFQCSPFRRYKFSLGLLKWLYQNAQQYDIAHIHALFSPVSSTAATVARLRGLPYILRPLGTLDPADLKKKKQLKKIYAQLLEKPNLQGATGIHFTSEQEAKISERFGAATTDIIIPLGVELSGQLPTPGKARQKYNIPPKKPLILFMSRIDPKKGFDLLFPALANLKQAGVDFHFVLAGSNPQDPVFEKSIGDRISSQGLADCTTITGFVGGDNKLALLQDADLFVLPSYYENFGIAVAEAMLAGLPVLISDQVHIWDAVQAADAGWVTPCNSEEIQTQLKLALATPTELEKRGKNAQHLAKAKYSWDAIAKQMLQTYHHLLTP
ncbi:hormogonium polysaccharide biosynthesis glycosyltransferase HpsP [Spirulina sp. CS-785/01]|uniref:hormogonium polysaccharide biosynthesis glycosyltransferase HpsP n=1 Tax=Spirulina sp. CS-785/01 TaxID=3021716 RepID=UPI003FA73416